MPICNQGRPKENSPITLAFDAAEYIQYLRNVPTFQTVIASFAVGLVREAMEEVIEEILLSVFCDIEPTVLEAPNLEHILELDYAYVAAYLVSAANYEIWLQFCECADDDEPPPDPPDLPPDDPGDPGDPPNPPPPLAPCGDWLGWIDQINAWNTQKFGHFIAATFQTKQNDADEVQCPAYYASGGTGECPITAGYGTSTETTPFYPSQWSNELENPTPDSQKIEGIPIGRNISFRVTQIRHASIYLEFQGNPFQIITGQIGQYEGRCRYYPQPDPPNPPGNFEPDDDEEPDDCKYFPVRVRIMDNCRGLIRREVFYLKKGELCGVESTTVTITDCDSTDYQEQYLYTDTVDGGGGLG